MGNIGEMYMKSHDFDRALEYLNTSLELKNTGHAPTRSIASTLFNIARVHKRMGKQDTAMVEFNQALEVFQNENHLAGLMETYVERGLRYLGLNRHIDALQDCQTGLRLATE